jgi:hypothetical protein
MAEAPICPLRSGLVRCLGISGPSIDGVRSARQIGCQHCRKNRKMRSELKALLTELAKMKASNLARNNLTPDSRRLEPLRMSGLVWSRRSTSFRRARIASLRANFFGLRKVRARLAFVHFRASISGISLCLFLWVFSACLPSSPISIHL